MKRRFYKFIFFKLMGWKIDGTIPIDCNKCVMMVMPHTSWHDFYLGIFTRGILNMEMNYVAKKELFRFPFGFYFRYMGGEPLDRTGGLNRVEAIAAIFKRKETFRLAILPEGTRKKVTELKSGFYFIAVMAEVPIIPVAFNFGKKTIGIGKPFYPTGNWNLDSKILEQFFKGVKGKIPELSYEV